MCVCGGGGGQKALEPLASLFNGRGTHPAVLKAPSLGITPGSALETI